METTDTKQRKRGPRVRGARYFAADVMFDPAGLEELDAMADRLRRTRSDLVREAVRARLPKWKRDTAP